MTRRITADIDNKNIFVLLYYLTITFIFIRKITEVKIRKSNSKGYHLIVWTDKNYNKKKMFKFRALIGDDKNRIELDKIKKGVGEQTLFYKKVYKNGKKKQE